MENDSSGENKTGARSLETSSFPYIRDGDVGGGRLYQETLNLVSRARQDMLEGKMGKGIELMSGL